MIQNTFLCQVHGKMTGELNYKNAGKLGKKNDTS